MRIESGIIVLIIVSVIGKSIGEMQCSVKFTRVNKGKPLINSQTAGSSDFTYNYNTGLSHSPPGAEDPKDYFFIRAQNKAKESPDPYAVGPSEIPLVSPTSGYITKENVEEPITMEEVKREDVILEAEGPTESYGVEDTRVQYRAKDGYYYMFYSAVEQYPQKVVSRLAMAKTRTPTHRASWERVGPLFPDIEWSKSGALILRDEEGGPHYLIWGDHFLNMAITYDLVTYKILPGPFLKTRGDKFDSALVESGPPPMKLTTGHYLFIYNSARDGYPSPRPDYDKQYNVGYLILDKDDPTKILYRSDEPFLSPELKWEKGEAPYMGLVPNVVFCEGAKPLGDDQFFLLYGAADSCLGAGLLEVSCTE